MIGIMVIGLRVGHEPEDTTCRVTNTRDVMYRSIGIFRKFTTSPVTGGEGISEHHLVILFQSVNESLICIKLAFTMADGKFHL